MRVISGKYKGLHIKAVPGQSTRPTTDKVKEAIFNMAGPYFEGGTVLDLYGGSGGLAIEALSRGMDEAVIVDRDKKAVETIYSNLKACRIPSGEASVFRNEASRALKALVKREIQFDLIFLDPPYLKHKLPEELEFIGKNNLSSKNGTIVVEHSVQVALEDSYETLSLTREERYGDTVISIYRNEV
jgi:16S rRNA (guanine(966)-N(2))-methyltransferase RsmD